MCLVHWGDIQKVKTLRFLYLTGTFTMEESNRGENYESKTFFYRVQSVGLFFVDHMLWSILSVSVTRRFTVMYLKITVESILNVLLYSF